MPPRKKKAKITNKNDKILTGKLMQLSLIIDDHIYKNVRISAVDAKIFLRDLTSLKERIKKNIRLSQVAEKLTREMRGIIAEEQDAIDPLNIDHQDPYKEHYSCNSQSYNHNDAPRYSPAQYDSLYKSEQNTVNKEKEMKHKKVETVIKQMNMFNETKQQMTGFDTDSAKSVHVFDDQAHEQNTVDKEKEMKQNKVKTVITQMNKFDKSKVHKTGINKDSAKPEHVFDDQAHEQKTVDKEKEMKQNKVKTVIKQMNKFDKSKVHKTGINTDYAKPEHVFDDQAHEQKTVDKEKEMKQNKGKTVKKLMNKLNETKAQKTGINTDSAKPVHVSNDQSKKMPIEIDLSWIEGVKYVRIIDESEYIPSHESVWDGCEFPQSWNESDFNYY